MAEPKRKPRPKTVKGIAISVWDMNGGPLPEEIVERLESAVELVKLEYFNEGHRLLSQTSRG